MMAAANPAGAVDSSKPVKDYVPKLLTVADGLPQPWVQAITQTPDGYMWFGTQEGIARFNGAKFKTFDQNNTPGINHNNIRTLLYDESDGSLWIGTYGGGLSRYQAGKFRAYTVEDGLPGNFVFTLAQGPAGELWIGTDKGPAVLRNGKITAVKANDEALKHPVSDMIKSPDGSMWFLIGNTIYRAGRAGVISPIDSKVPEPRALYADREGHIWIGTMSQGLYQWSGGKITHYGSQSSYPKTPVRAIYQDKAGSIWIAFYGAGLCRLQPDNSFDCYLAKDGLPESSLVSIYEDREGNLWLGTEANGVIRLRDTNFVIYDKRMGLVENYVLGIHQSRDGVVWVGTRPGLNRMKDGKITNIRLANSLPGNTVAVIEEGEQGDLWVGTEQGLKLLRNETVIKTFTTRDGLASNTIHALLRDHQGNLWIGDRMGGLTRYKDGKFTRFTQKDGPVSVRVRNIFEDHEGSIWFSTEEGLTRFRDGKFDNFALERGPGGATGGAVCVYEDTYHVFWIGTYGSGLVRFQDGKFVSFKRKDGLFDDSIWSIVEDASGNLWMSSNRGLFRASKRNLNDFASGAAATISSISYGTVDGLLTTDFNGGEQATGWKTQSGKLLFATSIGLVEVDPSHLRLNKLPPPVIIEDTLADKRSLSNQHHAPVGRGELEFQFAGLSFVAPEKVVFRYKLEGFDKDWTFSGGRRVAYYTNIPPGTYQFRVQAANDDGLWNDSGAVFDLYLTPHFYQTSWFILLCICGGILIVIGAYRLRMRQLNNREQELVNQVDERTKKLQEEIVHRKETEKQLQEQIVERNRATESAEAATRAKSEFLANMSHEIRTPLNGVMATLELAAQTELNDEQKELLQMTRDSADALLLVLNDILDFSKIEAGRLKFEEMEFQPADTLAEAARTMAVPAHQKKLELSCMVASDVPACVMGDSARLKQVLMNLLGNAVKFTDKGEVTLKVETEGESEGKVTLRFSVADTGIGIPKEKQAAIFEAFSQADSSVSRRFGGTGLGLAICARIVDLFGGHLWVESEPGKGSVFFFTATFKMGKAAENQSHVRKTKFLQGRKVLVVDDNRTSLGIVEQMLRDWGMRVMTTTSGAAAHVMLKQAFAGGEPFDLLLVDCDMPGMNGFTLMQEVNKKGGLVAGALMMLTAHDLIDSIGRCKRIGVEAHVIKPVKQAELLAALESLIRPEEKQTVDMSAGSHSFSEPIHLRILLAEDNAINQKLSVKLLEKMGHEVTVANNGRLAMDYLRNNHVDLIFMDVHMPELDGYAATRAIRAWEKTRGMGEHVPIIAMTASAMAGDREKCLQAGMDGYVSKPISQKELIRSIQQACELLQGMHSVQERVSAASVHG
jgi:signal transduction histidine kinase/ligand-binding sensor domain-containing protein/DNA-binding response OmpR family regulator